MEHGERIVAWVNASAGRGSSRSVGDRFVEVAEERGHSVERLPADLPAAVDATRAAIADGAERVVAVGGDGTIHQAIQVVAGTGVAFGVVPAGSGNDFAAGVGLPHDTSAAIDRALGPVTPIDLIHVGDRWGATVATLGLSVAVTVRADRLRWPRGGAKYTVASLLELPQMRRYGLRLVVDGVTHEVEPNLVGIANTSMFGGGMRIAPDAEVRDGLLDVVLLGPSSRLTMLGLLPKAGSGGHVGHPDVTVLRGARIEIDADESFRVDADGEPAGHTPIVIEAVSGALRLAGTDSRTTPI